jgi:hypothetical protein
MKGLTDEQLDALYHMDRWAIGREAEEKPNTKKTVQLT